MLEEEKDEDGKDGEGADDGDKVDHKEDCVNVNYDK